MLLPMCTCTKKKKKKKKSLLNNNNKDIKSDASVYCIQCLERNNKYSNEIYNFPRDGFMNPRET